ncbi:MAG: AAA family ATPase [Planctomycetes bacterium]|nr:AAA family ATPase [Planctomycetota bacterium]
MPETLAQYCRRVFGLRPAAVAPPRPATLALPGPAGLHVLLGDSGAGKTRALKALGRAHRGARFVRPCRGGQRVADLFSGTPGERAFACLAACGLADARLWALRAGQLSAGEQARLGLALALRENPPLLLVDEFDSHLDFDCARALACNLRRLATARGLRVVLTTHRPELLPWLQPDAVLRLGDGLQTLPLPAPADLRDELAFAPGSLADWRHFARWHYLGQGRPGPVCAVWLALLSGRPAGIAVFGYPHLLLSARAGALGPAYAPRAVLAQGTQALNRDLRLLSRVVVDPRLRGCGVAGALLRHALPRLGVPFVECIAQMADHSGFLQQAGFARLATLTQGRAAQSLLRELARRNLDPARIGCAQLADPALARRVAALVQSRIQTGHGSLRRGRGNAAVLARRALERLGARPGYFLWRRSPA